MDLLYAKYNRHRLPQFQIETSIWRDGGRKFVLKKALASEAAGHLRRLHEQAAPIRAGLLGGRLRLPEVAVVDAQTLRFEFVEGRSLDALLADAFHERNKTRFNGVIADYTALLNSAFTVSLAPVWSDAMRQVFALESPARLDGLGPFLTPALADPVFENILTDGNDYYLVDHEWVFEGCLPIAFVLFRSLFYFYEKFKVFGIEEWAPLASLLESLGIQPQAAGLYREMDEAFQAHVFGRERCYRYKDRYVKCAHSVPALLKIIEDQRQAMAAVQNNRGWKFAQNAGRMLDRRFPKGTLRRRVLERILRRLQACM